MVFSNIEYTILEIKVPIFIMSFSGMVTKDDVNHDVDMEKLIDNYEDEGVAILNDEKEKVQSTEENNKNKKTTNKQAQSKVKAVGEKTGTSRKRGKVSKPQEEGEESPRPKNKRIKKVIEGGSQKKVDLMELMEVQETEQGKKFKAFFLLNNQKLHDLFQHSTR